MEKKFEIIIIALIAILITSCYKVMDQEPTDRYTDAVVWKDPYLVNSYLAQLYKDVPVMVGDATTSANQNRTLMNVQNVNLLGFAAQFEGPVRSLGISDEAKYNFGAQANLLGIKQNGVQISGSGMDWWGNAYYSIRNLNQFIKDVNSSPLTDAKELIAEARFLRAFCYFAMVKRYGGVPLVTEAQPIDADSSALYPKRNSEKEIYDFILNETLEISKILPPASDIGRANKWAALALRSRTALFAASIARFGSQQLNGLLGFPSSEADKYYKIAYDASHTIMTGSPYKLYDEEADKVQNYKDIFLKKGNSEAIFVVQHSGPGWQEGGDNLWSWDMVECPRPSVWGVGNYHGPYLEMVESFECKDGSSGKMDRSYAENREWTMQELWGDRDPRFFANIWTNGTSWPGAVGGVLGENKIDMHNGIITYDGQLLDGKNDAYQGIPSVGDQLVRFKNGNVPSTGFGVMKYLDPNANNFVWFCESTTDYIVFRYAEILLNYAEAAFQLGKRSEALDAINKIRDRAGIAKLSAIDREKIRHERKVELAFEDHRYWDLRRWRIAVQALNRTYTGLRYIYDVRTGKYRLKFIDNIDGFTNTPSFPKKNYYWPIGNSRISANPNLIENPGY